MPPLRGWEDILGVLVSPRLRRGLHDCARYAGFSVRISGTRQKVGGMPSPRGKGRGKRVTGIYEAVQVRHNCQRSELGRPPGSLTLRTRAEPAQVIERVDTGGMAIVPIDLHGVSSY